MKETIEKVKILVYDSKHVFFRYFKKKFPDYFFVSFSGKENDDFVLNDYDIIIFIVGNHMEYGQFFKIYNRNTPLIFGSSVQKISNRIEDIKIMSMLDIKLIDMEGTKADLSDQIQFHLDQYSMNRLALTS